MLQGTIEPITNREDWIERVEVRDESNALVNLTGSTIVVAVRERMSKQAVLNGSTISGEVIIDALGTFQWTFPLAQMRNLTVNQTYDIGCTIKNGSGITRQFFIGSVPVLDGIVP
jgi:hypothetical protein